MILARFLSLFKRRPKARPEPLPVCARCHDDLLLPAERVTGLCVDCDQPAYYRRDSPRPFGKATQ